MTQASTYRRVDLRRIGAAAPVSQEAAPNVERAVAAHVRWMVIPLSVVLCVAQAVITIIAGNVRNSYLTSTLIPVIAFGVLFLIVLGVNPLARLARQVRERSVGGSISTAAAAALLAVGLCGLSAYGGGLLDPLSPALATVVSVLALMGGLAAALFLLLLLVGMRPFNRVEVMTLFSAMMVTAGISTFGLTDQLIPMVATPYNPDWNTPQSGWDDRLTPHMNDSLYIRDADTIRLFREGVPGAPPASAGFLEKARHWGLVFRSTPWGAWVPPLGYWLVFVAASYGLFYCLVYIVLGYWSQREKLIFPLAKLPEALLPDEESRRTWIPEIFRTPGFWLGFTLAALVLSWNAAIAARWIAGVGALPLGMSRASFDLVVTGTAWEGLGFNNDFGMMFLIIFTAIGISFLLPLEISFSIWFYFLVGKFVILALVWMGYGRSGADFPSDPFWLNNPMTAQGGGAIFLFSAVSLYRCIKDYWRLARGRPLGEAIRLALPVIGLVVCMVLMTLWLSWNNVNPLWALLIVAALTLVTVGLMRIVAEGGIYWFQAHTSFFHVYQFTGMGKVLAGTVVGPLLAVYYVLFFDIKTFLAPSLLNAAKMRDDVGGSRTKFHLNIVLCIAITVVVSLGFAVFLSHLRGAQTMSGWFYTDGPKWIMESAFTATTRAPERDWATAGWYGTGAVWTAVSLIARRTLFWFPHPIGYIMLINPLTTQLWFSFFIGWVCKKIVVRYGGKATFDKVRTVFIGLILGELIAIFVWSALALYYDFPVGITLNRYS